MTAIEPRAAAPVTPWELLARQADVLASSAIIPRQYQGRPEDIIAAGLMGHELGWGVMTSLQLIHVVEGKPEVSAEGMVALIRRAGHSVGRGPQPVTSNPLSEIRRQLDRIEHYDLARILTALRWIAIGLALQLAATIVAIYALAARR